MNYILFDDNSWQNLLPLTFTRPVSEIRCGILTITEKWEKFLKQKCSFATQDYLSEKYPMVLSDENIFINGSVIPNLDLFEQINQLKVDEYLMNEKELLAVNIGDNKLNDVENKINIETLAELGFTKIDYNKDCVKIKNTWDIFRMNGDQIAADFKLLTEGRKSAPISSTNQIAGRENIFLEDGAVCEFSILNATNGYIYLGKDSEIMEGCMVRGSFALGEHSTLKMGAKIYGPTTIGQHSKVGGEINNSVIFGFSNKAHDGFLGNSVIGEWCNIGADSNNSNLKNNYAEVRLWNYEKASFVKTGLQFCGLIMADHAKCGINTMFNTGTVVGVSANVFGTGFPRNFIPDFSWGGAAGFEVYALPKVFEVAQKVMERRDLQLTDIDKQILKHIFEITEKHRRF